MVSFITLPCSAHPSSPFSQSIYSLEVAGDLAGDGDVEDVDLDLVQHQDAGFLDDWRSVVGKVASDLTADEPSCSNIEQSLAIGIFFTFDGGATVLAQCILSSSQ